MTDTPASEGIEARLRAKAAEYDKIAEGHLRRLMPPPEKRASALLIEAADHIAALKAGLRPFAEYADWIAEFEARKNQRIVGVSFEVSLEYDSDAASMVDGWPDAFRHARSLLPKGPGG
jgi:hypothetical protein